MFVIEALAVVAMPFIVSYVTDLSKKAAVIAQMGDYRTYVIRGLLGVHALLGAILTQALVPDGVIDTGVVETAVLSIINAVGATVAYFYLKNRKLND